MTTLFVPVPLAATAVKIRLQLLRALIKYHRVQDRAVRPKELKYVPHDLLVQVKKHRKKHSGQLIAVYVAPGYESEYQAIVTDNKAVWLAMPTTTLPLTVILLVSHAYAIVSPQPPAEDNVKDPPPLALRTEICMAHTSETRLVYECKTANVSGQTGTRLRTSNRLQSLLPPSPGEINSFARLSKILPPFHSLWTSYTRGNPNRWTWESFQTIALNLSEPHPWVDVMRLISASAKSPAELYEYWLQWGYDALMDHVLEYSQEGPVNGPNVNEEEKEATWTSRVTDGIFLAMPGLDATLRSLLEALVDRVAQALRNPRRLDCTVANLQKHVATRALGRLSEPCVVITQDDVIVAWYLPEVLDSRLLDKLERATSHIEPLCARQIATASKASWRTATHVHVCPEGAIRQPGTANLSPGYFDQAGHRVVSAALQDPRCKPWMTEMLEVQSFLDTTLLLTHPSQYVAGVSVVADILADPDLHRRAPDRQGWPSHVWQGISVMINRVTPLHVDAKGDPAGFDLLLAAGPAVHAELTVPELNGSFIYLPGTIVLLQGKQIKHQVKAWTAGDRICYAQWIRKRSVDENELVRIDWCTADAVQAGFAKLAALQS